MLLAASIGSTFMSKSWRYYDSTSHAQVAPGLLFLQYELSTFTEARATAWASKPYRGEPVDGPERGAEPGMWEVHVNAPPMFEDGEERTEVPHTASVRMCQECGGVGRRQCWKCQVRGVSCCLGNYKSVVTTVCVVYACVCRVAAAWAVLHAWALAG